MSADDPAVDELSPLVEGSEMNNGGTPNLTGIRRGQSATFAPSIRSGRTSRNRPSAVSSFGSGLRVSHVTGGDSAAGDDKTAVDDGDKAKRFSPNGQLNSLTRLQMDLDTNRQMHRLAARYFNRRHFWHLFLPSIAITMLSGILAFLSDSGSFTENLNSLFAVSVGILSVISIFFQTMIKELDFGHRGKMHENVSMDLRLMQDDLAFDQLEVLDCPEALQKLIKINQERYSQIMQSCKSVLPGEIYNAYELVSTRMALLFMPPVKFDENDPMAKSKVEWISLMEIINNELFNAFASSPGWPLKMPRPQTVVTKAHHSLVELLKENQPPRPGNINVYELLLHQQETIQDINQGHAAASTFNYGAISGDAPPHATVVAPPSKGGHAA